MKTYKLTVFVEVDEKNSNAPSLQQLTDVARDIMETPDNNHYGIVKVTSFGEEVENFE